MNQGGGPGRGPGKRGARKKGLLKDDCMFNTLSFFLFSDQNDERLRRVWRTKGRHSGIDGVLCLRVYQQFGA